MPDPIDWSKDFYPSATKLELPESGILVATMQGTGKTHKKEFDFPPPQTKPHPPAHQILEDKANDGTWMRIAVGYHGNNKQVVIIYHRLQHFPDDNRWSVSVGVHKKVFLDEAADGFANLAQSILDQLRYDALNRLPDNMHVAELVIYDHIYTEADGTNGVAPIAKRTTTDIGKLGVVAQDLIQKGNNKNKWKAPDIGQFPRPQKDGKSIPGWGRDKDDGTPIDATVIRTILTPKP